MIRQCEKLWRLIRINHILVRHGVDQIIYQTNRWCWPIMFINRLIYWRRSYDHSQPRAQRLRFAIEELGPIFVKFGQMLSTRRDLLSADIAEQLTHLQDRVPPFSGRKARAAIEKAYQKPVGEIFKSFDENALASASIAQVHAATLLTGESVVVKIRRPGILKSIKRDIALLMSFADLLEKLTSDGRRLRPREVVVEFEKTLLDELDFMREAANASQIKRNFKGQHAIHIPTIHWQLVRENILTMERIHGVSVSDLKTLKEKQFNLKEVAEIGVELLFTQIFRDCFFHADMHPGNIFINPNSAGQPQYLFIDFGIVGTLSPNDQRYLAENFLAFFKRDYRRVAQLHVESGWVPYQTRVDEFESAIRTVSEPMFEQPLKDISIGQILLRLFQTARRFHMEIQPQLTLLQKTILNVEGIGRQLYPELDLWRTAQPYMEKWMRKQVGVHAGLSSIKTHWPLLAQRLPELPDLIYHSLCYVNDLKRFHTVETDLAPRIKALKLKAKRKGIGLGLLLGVALAGLIFYYI